MVGAESDWQERGSMAHLDPPANGEGLIVGRVYRYVEKGGKDPSLAEVDGLPNFWHATADAEPTAVQLEAGINPVALVNSVGGSRRPVIPLRSSPHKRGREETPWQDVFSPDVGHVRFFGDNKPRLRKGTWKLATAVESTGNRIMLEARDLMDSPDPTARALAPPVVLFQTVPHQGVPKGHVMFQGFGVIERVEYVTQFHPKSRMYFTNLVFDIAILRPDDEATGLDWTWIRARRDGTLHSDACLELAPESWRQWVRSGSSQLSRVRRRLSHLATKSTAEQMPEPGSREDEILTGIYRYFSTISTGEAGGDPGRASLARSIGAAKTRFEALAEIVAERVLQTPDGRYSARWITRGTGDEGVDFVGTLRVGGAQLGTELIVLGQAKCESLTDATGGVHIARTVARLRRGWIGVYVTTSFFSAKVQQEVIEDDYPVVLISGGIVARIVDELLLDRGVDLWTFLREVEIGYTERLSPRRPEEARMHSDPPPGAITQ